MTDPTSHKSFYETGVDPDLTGGAILWMGIYLLGIVLVVLWLLF